jgi:cyclopropane fatty-acyl-phospholipid synthase-like methyltransferase
MMRILRHWFKKPGSGSVAGKYSCLELNDHEIANGVYKQHLGGGEQEWDSRGRFQLSFLISQGMRPESRLLDVGCGPLRAGVHFISYLDKGNYCGVDYNPSFIKVATRLVEEKNLSKRCPTLRTISDFDFSELDQQFDYVIAFSVLNHCNETQRALFFANLKTCLGPYSKIIMSHAGWLHKKHLENGSLRVIQKFEASDLDLTKHGWPDAEAEHVYPIYALGPISHVTEAESEDEKN